MDKRTTAIVATVAAAILCGCPGLISLCLGAISSVAIFIPGAEIDVFGSSDPQAALPYGIGTICLGIVLVAIPIIIGLMTLRNRSETAEEPVFEEPLPPPN